MPFDPPDREKHIYDLIQIPDPIKELVDGLTSVEARQVFLYLIREKKDGDLSHVRQELFIAHYIENGGNKVKAAESAGIHWNTALLWMQKPEFRAMLRLAIEDKVCKIRKVAEDKALNGDKDLLMFFLSAYEPEIYDSRVRAQRIANEGTKEAITHGIHEISEARLRELLINDPAQEYLALEQPEVNGTDD